MGNREKATKEILKYIGKMSGSDNVKMYEELLGNLSDKKFDEYMTLLQSGEETLFIVEPNLMKSKLSSKKNITIARELGHEMYEEFYITDPETDQLYLTPIKYLIIDLPVRRQAQTLKKKNAIPKFTHRTDELTGQVTGESTASLSLPALQALHAQGLDKTITEIIKFRGGDERAFREYYKELVSTGSVSLESIDTDSKVRSTETLGAFLKAMHFDNNL